MAKFTVTVYNPADHTHERQLEYDNSDSTLIWADTREPVLTDIEVADQPDVGQIKIPVGKQPNTIKIQLGLECNFSCDYCNQRFVPHSDSHNPQDIKPFVDNMENWFNGGTDGMGEGTKIEFWGGEPLVYWKTLKPLAEMIHGRYPHAIKSIITNGSLLDEEKSRWLNALNFHVAVSHDGPGQGTRGPDPLEDPVSRKWILEMYKRLAPANRFSFNIMIHARNASRAECQQWFEELILKELGDDMLDYLVLGEGTFIDAYDEGGLANSLMTDKQQVIYRQFALQEIRDKQPRRFGVISQKVTDFVHSIKFGLRSTGMGQKCGMDQPDNMTVDLDGNVLTCQNVSSVSTNPAGISHKVGHVSDLDAVELKSSTHWSDREECPKCPVLHICRGACMFLSGPLWEASCNNAYSDNVVMFATAIESMTGMIPKYIDGPLRENRKDIFWWVGGEQPETNQKIIPIKAI
jgi:uncharacterized protein